MLRLYDSLSNTEVLINPAYIIRVEPCGVITHVWVEGRERHYQFNISLNDLTETLIEMASATP